VVVLIGGRAGSLARAACALAALAAVGCDDPPPYANAGRLQQLPGEEAGAALVAADASVAIGDDAGVTSDDGSDETESSPFDLGFGPPDASGDAP